MGVSPKHRRNQKQCIILSDHALARFNPLSVKIKLLMFGGGGRGGRGGPSGSTCTCVHFNIHMLRTITQFVPPDEHQHPSH